MSFWEADNLREAAGGRWLQRPDPNAAVELRGVSTDTRTLQRGQVFVALRGDHHDAHDYLGEAANAGAAILIVERDMQAPLSGAGVIRVDNTFTALARLAAAYRRTLPAEVIAITGSVGKTTTKHLLDAVLSTHIRGSASPKSYNNRVGVPLTVLAADPADRYLIVEIGANGPGEIGALSHIVEPDVAIITHVALAHLEGLGSLERIAAEKAGILRHLKDDGLAIVNGDLPVLDDHLKAIPRVIRYGRGEPCDLRLTDCDREGDGLRFTINERATFTLPLLGEHNAINAMAVVAAARHMNLSDAQIAEALAKGSPAPMRMEVVRVGTGKGPGDRPITIVNDAYNANPESMRAGVATLVQMDAPQGRRVAVLADMAELGEHAPQLHRELGKHLAEAPIDRVILIGPMSLYVAEGLSRQGADERAHVLGPWSEDVAAQVARLVEPGDVVLLKGSRIMGLERLIEVIGAHHAR